MLLNFEIIWTRIGWVIREQNGIDFSEIHLKGYEQFWNNKEIELFKDSYESSVFFVGGVFFVHFFWLSVSVLLVH